jgi:hypothetical protein
MEWSILGLLTLFPVSTRNKGVEILAMTSPVLPSQAAVFGPPTAALNRCLSPKS